MRTAVFSKVQSKTPVAACDLAGEPMHWEADYCMYKAETDDFESEAVQKCVKEGSPEIWKVTDNCQKNKLFKKKICGLLSKSKSPSFKRICEKNELPASVEGGGVEP